MMQISEADAVEREPTPFLRLAFRPFYLLAACFGALAVPLWLAHYLGWMPGWIPPGRIDVFWHMHEMVFGFGCAVVIGFLLTASRTWTGLWTTRGTPLAALAVLWLAGRIAMAAWPPAVAAALDLPLLPIVAIILGRLMWRSGKRRNLRLVALLALLTTANLVYHLAAMQVIALSPALPVQSALLLLIVLSSVMGARVIPMFTANGAGVITMPSARLDALALSALAACFAAWIAGLPGALVALLSVIGAGAHFIRMRGWRSARTLAFPLLWVLHLAFGWIGIGTLLLGAAALGWVAGSVALHALALGAMGSLIAGMLCRTTRGHTGQKMVAGAVDVAIFAAIQGGTVARVAAGLCPGKRTTLLIVSAVLWSAAFLLYLIKFAPALFKPRLDGRAG